MEAIIYYNPKCSKSREALQILKEKGIFPQVVHYLETPPSDKELSAIVKKLQIEPKELIRFKEKKAKELNLSPLDNSNCRRMVFRYNQQSDSFGKTHCYRLRKSSNGASS